MSVPPARAAHLFGSVVMVCAIVLLVSGCGGASGSSAAKGGSGATATIAQFEVPATAECQGKTSATVTVRYKVVDAAKQQLVVDGLVVEGADKPSGTIQVPIHCDPLPHTFVMAVYDSSGKRTTQQKLVTTNL